MCHRCGLRLCWETGLNPQRTCHRLDARVCQPAGGEPPDVRDQAAAHPPPAGGPAFRRGGCPPVHAACCVMRLTRPGRRVRAQGLHYTYQEYRQQADAFQAQARFLQCGRAYSLCRGQAMTCVCASPAVGRQAPCAGSQVQRAPRGAGVLVRRTRRAASHVVPPYLTRRWHAGAWWSAARRRWSSTTPAT